MCSRNVRSRVLAYWFNLHALAHLKSGRVGELAYVIISIGVGFDKAERKAAYCLAAIAACSMPSVSVHAARKPQSDVAVMRETGDEVSASVAESVDTALVRALAEVAGISRPSLSPVDYGEVQLTVG